MAGLASWLKALRVGRPKRERLLAEIAMTRERVSKRHAAEARKCAASLTQAPEQRPDRSGARFTAGPWHVHAEALLALAEKEAGEGKQDAAWKHLYEARRQEVFGYTEAEVVAAACALRNEAGEKFGGWRRTSIVDTIDLLHSDAKPAGDDARCLLAFAMHLRDARYDDIYFKLKLVRRQVVWLVTILLLLLLLFAALSAWKPLFTEYGEGVPARALSSLNLLAGMVLGAIGACFSGLVSLTGASPGVSIPERIASTSVTLARPLIGAASALAALLLLTAGLLAQFSAGAIYAAAFAAGFSERLAIGAIDRLASK